VCAALAHLLKTSTTGAVGQLFDYPDSSLMEQKQAQSQPSTDETDVTGLM
jgi:hypothetical protein